MKLLHSLSQSLCLACVLVLLLAGVANAQLAQFPDNEARSAILRERQRIDAVRMDFDKLRIDAESTRREMENIRRDLDKERQRIDLTLRKVVEDELRPISDSVRMGISDLELLRGAQLELLGQLEEARKEAFARSRATILLQTQLEQSRTEVRELRGKTEELEVQLRELRRKIELK